MIDESNLIILNDGTHTYQNTSTKNTSAIDLSMATTNIACNISWKCDMVNIGSDHFPITITIGNDSDNLENEEVTYVNNKTLKRLLKNFNPKHSFDLLDLEEEITNMIRKSSRSQTKKNIYTPKYWWTEKIEKMWKIKKEKQKIFNKTKNLYTAKELEKSVKELRGEIKKEKRSRWKNILESITPDTNLTTLWKLARNLSSNNFKTTNNWSSREIELFMDTNFKEIQENECIYEYSEDLEEEFNEDEVRNCIKNNGNTAPGLSGISNKLLKELPEEYYAVLTKHINQLWQKQVYPQHWKEARIIPIPKPNKDKNDVRNYRPISLLNVLAKLVDKLVKTKLEKFVEINNLLPNNSFGFRKGSGIEEHITTIVEQVEKNKLRNIKTILITTDISKAFDKVKPDILKMEMENMQISSSIVNWVHQSLTNRKATIKQGNFTCTRVLNLGITQGSSLSPILFNIYTRSIHEHIEGTKILQFADDFSLLIQGKTENELQQRAELAVLKVMQNLKRLNLDLNLEKTNFMTFYKKSTLRLNIQDITIKEVDSTKILGIQLNKKLNFADHNNIIKENASKFLNVVKALSFSNGGVHPKTMLQLHNAIIMSRLLQGAIWSSSAETKNKQLQVVQNQSLRICCGLTKTTPVMTIMAITGQIPIHIMNEKRTLMYMNRKIYKNTPIGKRIKKNESLNKFSEMVEKYPTITALGKTNTLEKNASSITIKENLIGMVNPKKEYNEQQLKSMALATLQEHRLTNRIYTDGSINGKRIGFGIYIPANNQIIKGKLKNPASIKTTEMIAILEAIKLTIAEKQDSCLILTDSKACCKSLRNYRGDDDNKYYENKILKILEQNNITIEIQWVPSHIGLQGNDVADEAAKQGASEENAEHYNNKIPWCDAKTIVNELVRDNWNTTYDANTSEKGRYTRELIGNAPPKKPWFHELKYNSKDTKILSRLMSGHGYDKKFLKIIGKESSSLCDTCLVEEDFRHTIETCTKYDDSRKDLKYIYNLTLEQIVRKREPKELNELLYFINQNEIQI